MSITGSCHVFLLQGAQAIAQRVQLPQRGGVLFPGRIVVEGEHAAVLARLVDRARDDGGRRDVHMVDDLEVAEDDRAAARPCNGGRCARCRPRRRSRPRRVCAPMCTLWPICTRLSSLTPSSITVSSSAPRSMQVLAPISTSSPMRTRAELLDLLPAACVRARSRSRRRRSRRRGARCRARRCGSPRRARPARRCACTAPTRRTGADACTAAPMLARGRDRRAPGSTTALGWTPAGAAPAGPCPPTTASGARRTGRGRA